MRKSIKALAALLVKVTSGAASREAKAKSPVTSRARTRRKALGLLKKLRNAVEAELPRIDRTTGEEIKSLGLAACPLCRKRYGSMASLGRHIFSDHPYRGPKRAISSLIFCQCGKKFKNVVGLARHAIKAGPVHATLAALSNGVHP